MFMLYVSNAGKTDEERSTEPGGILQKWMIFSGKPFKNGWFGATKGWYNSKCRIFFHFFNSKCMTWVSLWAILSAWFKYHWGAILSACHHVLRILTARRPLYIHTYTHQLKYQVCGFSKICKRLQIFVLHLSHPPTHSQYVWALNVSYFEKTRMQFERSLVLKRWVWGVAYIYINIYVCMYMQYLHPCK